MGLFGDADLKQLKTVLLHMAVMQRMKAERPDLYLATVGTESDGDAGWEDSRREAIELINALVARGKSAQATAALSGSGPRKGDERTRVEWAATVHTIGEQSTLE